MGNGYLKVELYAGDHALPVGGADVIVRDHKGAILYRLKANENGITDKVQLDAPQILNKYEPNSQAQYFYTYDVEVPAFKGYKKVIIHDVQIFDGITSILPVHMTPVVRGETPMESVEEIFIPHEHGVDLPHEHMQSQELESMEAVARGIAANDIVMPEYITVHLGSPNATATNVRVPFKDYIKNVASSEIFPWWDEAALYANIYAQITFTLNRVYTVWYRSRGKDFDITNSTSFDQYFVNGREIFDTVSAVVDRIFNMFIRRVGRAEPFFSIYYNGTTATCCGMSQWGSQDLAERGYTPIQILRYYYPSDVDIFESNNFSSNVGTFPGYSLGEGSSGEPVRMLQSYLNRISGSYYIPSVGKPDGVFGSATKNSVMAFQSIFNLSADGIVGKSTWYEIAKVYVAVRQLAELTSEGQRIGIGNTPPTTTVAMGDRGEYVVELQFILNFISEFYANIPFVVENGVFQDPTKRAVTEFQANFGLTPDGTVGGADIIEPTRKNPMESRVSRFGQPYITQGLIAR